MLTLKVFTRNDLLLCELLFVKIDGDELLDLNSPILNLLSTFAFGLELHFHVNSLFGTLERMCHSVVLCACLFADPTPSTRYRDN